MKFARITGTGSYLPAQIVTNADLEQRVDTSDAWIVERTGIRQRHIAAEHETASSMAYAAAQQALAMANIAAQQIDLIIVGTSTPDMVFPSTACLLQQLLGSSGYPAFDVSAACSGFIYALSIAEKFIRTGSVKTALVVGSDIMSRLVDWTDRKTCIIFGDGAGAAVLQASSEPGIYSTHLYANGVHKDLLYVPSNIAGQRSASESAYLKMMGSEVFKIAVNTLGTMLDDVLSTNQLQTADIDWLVPHQANLRIITAAAKKLNLPSERVVVTIDRHANTSAASIPLALDEAIRDGRIQPGQNILLEAFGAGMAWGSTLIRW